MSYMLDWLNAVRNLPPIDKNTGLIASDRGLEEHKIEDDFYKKEVIEMMFQYIENYFVMDQCSNIRQSAYHRHGYGMFLLEGGFIEEGKYELKCAISQLQSTEISNHVISRRFQEMCKRIVYWLADGGMPIYSEEYRRRYNKVKSIILEFFGVRKIEDVNPLYIRRIQRSKYWHNQQLYNNRLY